MSFQDKEYKLEKSENFDGFLNSLGLPEEEVAKLSQIKPTISLDYYKGDYIFTTVTHDRTKVVKFQPGVELDDLIKEGLTAISTYTVDGNTLTQIITKDNKSVTFKREFTDDKVKVTITTNFWDGVAYRYYSVK